MKNKTTAALLAFFLGSIGVQWIYLGSPGKFVLSFSFFWTAIPSFIALYQTIVFLTMTDDAFSEQYN